MPLPRPLVDANVQGWLNTDQPLTAADLEGRWVLVDLWATWCGPCVQSLPELADFHRRRPEIALVGIADDGAESLNQIRYLMDEVEGFDWPVAYGGTDAHMAYGIPGIPTLILYNPEGEEVVRGHFLPQIEMALMDQEAAL